MDDFLASGRGEVDQFPQLEFEQLPFNHPLFIMYSSGTTGAPKCMVHSAGVRATLASISSSMNVTLREERYFCQLLSLYVSHQRSFVILKDIYINMKKPSKSAYVHANVVM